MPDLVRYHGTAPFRTAVIHGGPGAPGSAASLARALSHYAGTIEPLQSADTLEGQISELHAQLTSSASLPVVLVGWSWGAVLSLFIAGRYPSIISRLILVGCAVFDAASSAAITARRLARLSENDRRRYDELTTAMSAEGTADRDAILKDIGELLSGVDSYDPIDEPSNPVEPSYHVHARVWSDFKTLRDTRGALTREFASIVAPTLLIHGDYDPHPIEGIEPFLSRVLPHLELQVLPECGHSPWLERRARDRFFELIRPLV